MESFIGLTFSTSSPSAVPVRVKSRVYTLPLGVILSGVAVPRVAFPPEMDNAKSDLSIEPLAPDVLYTFSLKVTSTLLLSSLTVKKEITGRTVSPAFTVKVLM